jgi:hypothetical protein
LHVSSMHGLLVHAFPHAWLFSCMWCNVWAQAQNLCLVLPLSHSRRDQTTCMIVFVHVMQRVSPSTKSLSRSPSLSLTQGSDSESEGRTDRVIVCIVLPLKTNVPCRCFYRTVIDPKLLYLVVPMKTNVSTDMFSKNIYLFRTIDIDIIIF